MSINANVPIDSNEPKLFLCEYQYEGNLWTVKIHAESHEDAAARLKQISKGSVLGKIEMSIPARIGWVAKALVWWQNIW